jgi:hypothetical protein
MRRFGPFLFLCAGFAAGVAPALADKRVALVVGNSAYQHTVKLANPKNDASDITAALKKHGFDVIQGVDLDKAAFDRRVRDFTAALKGADAGVFFYAGHGLQVAGQNYLVPVDAKADEAAALDLEMVRVDVVHRIMERQTSTNILFLDACRDNPLARNLARSMGTRSADIGRGLAAVESGIGTLISFSTQPGNVALDGTGRNSPFAAALLKQLKQANEDLSTILIAVRTDVVSTTKGKQVPWEHSALMGRFYFSAPIPEPKAVPADEATWGLIRDTKDPALLRRFMEQFPDSKRRPEAEQLAAGLAALVKPAEPPQPPPAPPKQPVSITPAPVAPPPPMVAGDEIAWRLIKDTSDLALLRRFVEQFPDSGRRAEAEQRAAALAAIPKAAPKPAEPPAAQPARKPAAGTGTGGTGKGKCFSFEGRTFCQ